MLLVSYLWIKNILFKISKYFKYYNFEKIIKIDPNFNFWI